MSLICLIDKCGACVGDDQLWCDVLYIESKDSPQHVSGYVPCYTYALCTKSSRRTSDHVTDRRRGSKHFAILAEKKHSFHHSKVRSIAACDMVHHAAFIPIILQGLEMHHANSKLRSSNISIKIKLCVLNAKCDHT